MSLYLDTSALMKWYVAESDSDAFDDFLATRSGVCISRLTIVELRSALARRRRNRDISAATERLALTLFETQVRDGLLMVLAMHDTHFTAAREILDSLPRIPMRTLDAVHLAVARANTIEAIATADAVMASAARALRFETHVFQ